jgi:predicted permease
MVPCMIFGNIIKNVDVERAKLVGILFLFPILTHLLAFSLGKILSLILKYKSEEEEYLLVVAGSTFGNHGMKIREW